MTNRVRWMTHRLLFPRAYFISLACLAGFAVGQSYAQAISQAPLQSYAQAPAQSHPQATANDETAMQAIQRDDGSFFWIDRTEVSIGQYRGFVQARGYRSLAEREGGGFEWGAGWERRPGWVWHSPYGKPGAANEPAVHLNWHEAKQFCQWAGKRLPSDAEWMRAAYTETRDSPPPGFVRGKSYPYPTGDSPDGANHREAAGAPLRHQAVGQSRAGVNGLFDMGANVWEWVDSGSGREQVTRGGSWWYGPAPMHRDHRALKPADFYVVYIGWRCVADKAQVLPSKR